MGAEYRVRKSTEGAQETITDPDKCAAATPYEIRAVDMGGTLFNGGTSRYHPSQELHAARIEIL